VNLSKRLRKQLARKAAFARWRKGTTCREVVLDAHKLSNAEARLVVASYYDAQEMRKRADMQIRHLGDKEMPKILQYTADANAVIENEVKKALLTT
jgi:hypothetical protein